MMAYKIEATSGIKLLVASIALWEGVTSPHDNVKPQRVSLKLVYAVALQDTWSTAAVAYAKDGGIDTEDCMAGLWKIMVMAHRRYLVSRERESGEGERLARGCHSDGFSFSRRECQGRCLTMVATILRHRIMRILIRDGRFPPPYPCRTPTVRECVPWPAAVVFEL